MRHTLFSILLLIFAISLCKSKYDSKEASVNNTPIDTILTLDSLSFFQSENPSTLTRELAHKTLLEYFTKREYYYPEEKISLDSLLTYPIENEDLLTCIGFDTLYTVHLNKDKVLDGIVTYWQMPCGASGNQWRPHRAIITPINNKYTIINTDFIPDYYSIDTIIQDNNNTYIHGKVFDRGILEFTRSYKASIKR